MGREERNGGKDREGSEVQWRKKDGYVTSRMCVLLVYV